MIMEHIRPRSSFKQLLHAWIDVVAAWLGTPKEPYERVINTSKEFYKQ